MRLVHITWIDSVTYGGWKHAEDIDEWAANAPYRMESVGYLLRELPDLLVLASSRSTQGDLQYSCLTVIPRAAVTAIRELDVGK